MSQPFMQYTPDEDEIWAGPTFQWHGGEYIEIGYMDEMGFTAHDVINVWDHEHGRPSMPRELGAFQARCDRWIAECYVNES